MEHPWTLGRRPALDGLRGVAIALVVFDHITGLAGGAAAKTGVTVFFALSGFLITSLLLTEWERRNRLHLATFYLRRALRLLPALVVCCGVLLVVAWVLDDARFANPPAALSALFYVANIVKAHDLVAIGAFGHTWSLSTEEQFYVVWPLVMLLGLRTSGRRGVTVLAGAGIVLAASLRLTVWDGSSGAAWAIYNSSWCHADSLLFGCLLASLMPRLARTRQPPHLLTWITILGIFAWGTASGWWLYVAMPLAVGALSTFAIWTLIGADAAETSGPLQVRWIRWLGERSYGIYLWHFPVVIFFKLELNGLDSIGSMVIALAVSLLLAVLSWRLVEKPFLRLKDVLSEDTVAEPTELEDPSATPR
jgi:peptidoglycan/LPS O-acetylase OafA/YrhL